MKSIAIVDHVGEKLGGHAQYTCELATALSEQGYNTCIYSNFFHKLSYPAKFYVRSGILNTLISHLNVTFLLLFQRRTLILHLFSFDIKMLVYILILKLSLNKVHLIVHDVNNLARSETRFPKIILTLAKTVSVHNEISKRELQPFTRKHIHIIPHGKYRIDKTKTSTKEESRNKIGLNQSSFVLLFFGQIKETKGLEILLDAVPHISTSGVELLIAGSSGNLDNTHYKKRIENLDISQQTTWIDRYIDNSEVYDFYNAADLCVLPYKNIYQSGVLLMAMSYGTPVLCSDLDAFRDLINDGDNGFLFETENPYSLANAIDKIISGRFGPLDNISQRAEKFMIDNFDWRVIAAKYGEIL